MNWDGIKYVIIFNILNTLFSNEVLTIVALKFESSFRLDLEVQVRILLKEIQVAFVRKTNIDGLFHALHPYIHSPFENMASKFLRQWSN